MCAYDKVSLDARALHSFNWKQFLYANNFAQHLRNFASVNKTQKNLIILFILYLFTTPAKSIISKHNTIHEVSTAQPENITENLAIHESRLPIHKYYDDYYITDIFGTECRRYI